MALCVALLIERKLANYDDPIIRYWPNFGKNGKANITIKMLLSQTVGYYHMKFKSNSIIHFIYIFEI